MSEDEPIECAIVTVRLIERVIGMLMHLWSLVPGRDETGHSGDDRRPEQGRGVTTMAFPPKKKSPFPPAPGGPPMGGAPAPPAPPLAPKPSFGGPPKPSFGAGPAAPPFAKKAKKKSRGK